MSRYDHNPCNVTKLTDAIAYSQRVLGVCPDATELAEIIGESPVFVRKAIKSLQRNQALVEFEGLFWIDQKKVHSIVQSRADTGGKTLSSCLA